jgi:hypothetical protein
MRQATFVVRGKKTNKKQKICMWIFVVSIVLHTINYFIPDHYPHNLSSFPDHYPHNLSSLCFIILVGGIILKILMDIFKNKPKDEEKKGTEG